MRLARWIDHLPPWLSFGAIATTGMFSPEELAVMALPLGAAWLVEYRRWSLERYRRVLEIAALTAVLAQVALRVSLVPLTLNTIFLLCGIRLALPREAAQRRQLILMGFLLFLVTAIATFEITFLFWALAWTVGSCMMLLQQSWEGSASLRRGLAPPPPYRQVFLWTAATVLIAGACFVVLPRQTTGLRFFPWGAGGLGGTAAGLSDKVELFDKGPIGGNRDVVLRILPPPRLPLSQREKYSEALQLLRGITLESFSDSRWEVRTDTPAPQRILATDWEWNQQGDRPDRLALELFVAPNPLGVIPTPTGLVATLPPAGMPLREGRGGSLRWQFPSRRWVPLRLLVNPEQTPQEMAPRGNRMAALLEVGAGTQAVQAWSHRVVPEDLPPSRLAQRLGAELRSYAYTTDNPSGKAANPIQDFLENTRAGHCEYFASSLALALRYRGIPARVINGYRLGPWIDEGGYWLVTQDQAHSWVEFLDPGRRGWKVADPTPSAPPSALKGLNLWATLQRWADALQFRWDRNVVRFSDEDQMAGLSWLHSKATNLPSWRPGRTSLLTVGLLAALALAIRVFSRGRFFALAHRGPQEIRALRPLLRKTKKTLPPAQGETARHWLQRLAVARPFLKSRLVHLAKEVDEATYGGHLAPKLKPLVREILRDLD